MNCFRFFFIIHIATQYAPLQNNSTSVTRWKWRLNYIYNFLSVHSFLSGKKRKHERVIPRRSSQFFIQKFHVPQYTDSKISPTVWCKNELRHHSCSTYAKLSEKLTFMTPWYVHVSVRSGSRNVSFSENFAHVLNGWSMRRLELAQINLPNQNSFILLSICQK